ncbi:hypothetical protein IQ265_22185 [Nodosilinea sp. LEGE 06152]|uniref:hypothetical protein n=1 Tax=Nodosilinea sp. LEGE 06152 TaxID=2777966 RepID=UPI00187EA143|nr:hypothetical protein [Nodosilinea sp. LEGE 06152]MBE9159519.1 hypothetical protein [Nodosilinea sp. LEGE 06152]
MSTLIALLLAGIYGGGAFKFWTGFNRTHFTEGKVKFTLLWPLFLALNKSYRENFSRALKG